MAKTGDSPDRKDKPKSKPRAARPSFAQPAAPAASSAWVYRSDAAAAPAAKPAAAAAAKAVAPAVKAAVVAPAAKPVVAPPASPRRRIEAPVVVAAAPVPAARSSRVAAARSSRVVHALDVVTLPIAVSLMAVLAPMRRLFGSSRQ
jgi:hypothetical protein